MLQISIIAAVAIWAASGLPSVLAGRRSITGQTFSMILTVLGSCIGIAAALGGLISGGTHLSVALPSPVAGASFSILLDPLAEFFLLPIFVVGALASVYGMAYWPQWRHPRTGRRLRLCYGLLIAALSMVVLAADGIAFLFAWEVMAIAAFLLVATEEYKGEARQASWIYLVSTHVSTLLLFALFALLRRASGSFELRALSAGVGWGMQTAIFLTALLGFGLKAGLMPLHFWLPSAHANAPSHVSAILSGVMLKVGVYGFLRVVSLLHTPPLVWGGLVLGLGTISAIGGVLFAIGQHDIKRLLAYHSVENIGIIVMGLGLAMIGQARGRPEWVALGLAGSLLHVWNHSLFKSLLFLAAGSVVHATGTRDIERMGGLARPMPATAFFFLLGAIAICGLPPLNGFVSELLVYLGLFKSVSASSIASLGAPALALAGALALACFIKVYGAVFLGPMRRSSQRAHESPAAMLGPMAVLGLACAVIGALPIVAIGVLDEVIASWSHAAIAPPALGTLVPIGRLTIVMAAMAVLAPALVWAGRRFAGAGAIRAAGTWDCGYAIPPARARYTASSFAQPLVRLFRGVLRPRTYRAEIAGPFAGTAAFESHVDDVALDGILRPMWRGFRARIQWIRALQQGTSQRYLLYIFFMLFLLLLLAIPADEIFSWLSAGEGR